MKSNASLQQINYFDGDTSATASELDKNVDVRKNSRKIFLNFL